MNFLAHTLMCFLSLFLLGNAFHFERPQWYPPNLHNDNFYFPTSVGGGVHLAKRGGPSPDMINTRVKLTNRKVDSSMVFPDDISEMPPPDPTKTSNCTIPDLCDSYLEYPAELIESLIKTKNYDHLFQAEERSKYPIEINPRFQGVEGSYPLCSSVQKEFTPKTGRNVDKQLQFIVNTKEYMQSITVEVCKEGATSCNVAMFPLGYESRCEQKYSVKRLIVVDSQKQELTVDKIEIPTCCVCTYTEPKSLRTRSMPHKRNKRRNVKIVP